VYVIFARALKEVFDQEVDPFKMKLLLLHYFTPKNAGADACLAPSEQKQDPTHSLALGLFSTLPFTLSSHNSHRDNNTKQRTKGSKFIQHNNNNNDDDDDDNDQPSTIQNPPLRVPRRTSCICICQAQ